MKKLLLITVIILLAKSSFSQQFSFNLYISDSLGHSDTLILGYDATATDSIDVAFGEVDIKSQAWDTVFEARICPYNDFDYTSQFSPKFESKKQIMFFNPQPPYNPYSYKSSSPFIIEMYSRMQVPFYLSWDSTLFADSALKSTYLSVISPSVSHWFSFWLSAQSSFVFQDNWETHDSYYIRNSDTVWVMAFQFVSYSTVGIQQPKPNNNNVIVYPNPCNDNINFEFENSNTSSIILIYNSFGQLMKSVTIGQQSIQHTISLSNLKSGIYYYQLQGKDSEILYSGKFIKQ